VEAKADHCVLESVDYSTVLLNLFLRQRLWEVQAVVQTLPRLAVLVAPVDVETFAILQVLEEEEEEALAVQAAVVLVAWISLGALLRRRLEGQRESRIWRTCPSTLPIAPDMDDRPSHHC
jgi:hypothetical protein